jgi:hypothetical protein
VHFPRHDAEACEACEACEAWDQIMNLELFQFPNNFNYRRAIQTYRGSYFRPSIAVLMADLVDGCVSE